VICAPNKEASARFVRISFIAPHIELRNILDQDHKLRVNNDEVPESLSRLFFLTEGKAKDQEWVDHRDPATIHHSCENHK